MSLEPAIALLVGFAVLDQSLPPGAVAGIVLVVAAGIGAERTGARVGAGTDADPGLAPTAL
jgi:inner membrane transporter RhtA